MSLETPNHQNSEEISQTGFRYNTGKPPIHLIPPEAIIDLAEHFARGAVKYPERNWERGLKWHEGIMASLLRHAYKWSMREDIDPENGAYHDSAILWNAQALVTHRIRRIGEDDRPRTPNTSAIEKS